MDPVPDLIHIFCNMVFANVNNFRFTLTNVLKTCPQIGDFERKIVIILSALFIRVFVFSLRIDLLSNNQRRCMIHSNAIFAAQLQSSSVACIKCQMKESF